MRLSDRREPVINRHLKCMCDGLKYRSGGFGGRRVKLIQRIVYKGSKCLQNIHIRCITYHNEHKMTSSKRCLRQVRINMICLTSESIQKQSTRQC
jgi:hypothetical protein